MDYDGGGWDAQSLRELMAVREPEVERDRRIGVYGRFPG
jgi:hypothetical protein